MTNIEMKNIFLDLVDDVSQDKYTDAKTLRLLNFAKANMVRYIRGLGAMTMQKSGAIVFGSGADEEVSLPADFVTAIKLTDDNNGDAPIEIQDFRTADRLVFKSLLKTFLNEPLVYIRAGNLGKKSSESLTATTLFYGYKIPDLTILTSGTEWDDEDFPDEFHSAVIIRAVMSALSSENSFTDDMRSDYNEQLETIKDSWTDQDQSTLRHVNYMARG